MRNRLVQLSTTVAIVAASVVATTVRHPFRLDVAVITCSFATGPAAGALALVTSLATIVHGGHLHLADLALLPAQSAAVLVGWRLRRRPSDVGRRTAWAATRFVAMIALSFVAAAVEEQIVSELSAPTLGRWSFTALGTTCGLLLGTALAWRAWRTPGSASTLGASLVVLATATVMLFTLMFWVRQDERLLHVTADATAVGLLTALTENTNIISAKSDTSSQTDFDALTFPGLVQSVVYGHESIHSAQLVEVSNDGSVNVLSQFSSMDEAFERAYALWTRSEAQTISDALHYGVLTYLDFAWLPVPTGGEQPYLIYASPIAVDGAFEGSRRLMVSAISLPTLIQNASAPTLAATGAAIISLYARTPAGVTAMWSTRAEWNQHDSAAPPPFPVAEEPADTLATRALATFSVNTTEFDLFIDRGVDFGSPLGFRRVLLVLELLAGLATLGLFLSSNAHAARRESERVRREALLGAALEGSPGWTAIIDEDDRVVMSNADPHGVGAGCALAEVGLWADDPESAANILQLVEAARSGSPSSLQHVWSEPADLGKGIRIFELEIRPLPDPTLVYLQCLDVTEHRDRAMRTSQSERMEAIGVLAGGLAHDFNNLLFITLGYLQMLQRQPLIDNNTQARTYVSRAIEAVDRGAGVAKSLLSFARSQPLTPVPLNLREFLTNLAPLVEQGLGPAHRLSTSISGDHPLDVVVDPGRLSSSLLNIVFNARDAMSAAGRLEIRVYPETLARAADAQPEPMIAISVTDTGHGIPPDVLTRAFEPFFTTKKIGSGTGLGLSTVYSFAQQSGGWAAIESTENVGTTVTIYLPPALDTDSAPHDEAPSGHDATRALVVDDEPALADLVAGWLESFGMQAKVAYTPQVAMRIADEFKPELLVSDANFGDAVDGLELAQVLVQRDPALLVVFMTGFSDRIKALQRAGVATLAKPFSSDDLYTILATHLGTRMVGAGHDGGNP